MRVSISMKAHITEHTRDKNDRRIDDFNVIMLNKTKVSREGGCKKCWHAELADDMLYNKLLTCYTSY